MKHYLKTTGIVMASMLFAMSCSEDENGDANMQQDSYDTTFKITDAPIDNANVDAVVVTITDVKVDGVSLEGFSATTVELSSLVNGQTETLGDLDLKARSYSNLQLVLDLDQDVNGNSPGCYVEMVNGEKDKLESAANTIDISDSFEILASSSNDVIIDFDLRKTIVESQGSAESDFKFVTASELSSALRVVNDEVTGSINGTVNDAENTSDKIVVYAYQKGTFDAETEMQGSGASNVTFANAVTSAEVSGVSNSYSLSFLKEGEYELIFVGYNDEDDDGVFEVSTRLDAQSTTNIDLGSISVSSALQISANVIISGTM